MKTNEQTLTDAEIAYLYGGDVKAIVPASAMRLARNVERTVNERYARLPAASQSVIAAAQQLIEADGAQALTTEHVNALRNAIAMQKQGSLPAASEADELREAAKAFYNATAADNCVRITSKWKDKTDTAHAAAERLRAALTAPAIRNPLIPASEAGAVDRIFLKAHARNLRTESVKAKQIYDALQEMAEYVEVEAYRDAAPSDAPAKLECPTCNDQGAVGNLLNAEPCPDCTPAGSPLSDARAQQKYSPNTIYHVATDGEGKPVSYGARDTFDPHGDMHVMTAAIEFHYAAKRGGNWGSHKAENIAISPADVTPPAQQAVCDSVQVAGSSKVAPTPQGELQAGNHCWCEACKPNTLESMRMIVCSTCGNKRCPHATNHRNACTGSNEPGQSGSSWENVKPAPAAQGDERAALTRLEAACDAVCRLRTQEQYLSMVDSGQQDALLELDNARTQARAALARQPSAGDGEQVRRDTLLSVLGKLNSNPYNLTKSECLDVVGAMFDKADADLGAARAPRSEKDTRLQCWNCRHFFTPEQRSEADGNCPHCGVEMDDGGQCAGKEQA